MTENILGKDGSFYFIQTLSDIQYRWKVIPGTFVWISLDDFRRLYAVKSIDSNTIHIYPLDEQLTQNALLFKDNKFVIFNAEDINYQIEFDTMSAVQYSEVTKKLYSDFDFFYPPNQEEYQQFLRQGSGATNREELNHIMEDLSALGITREQLISNMNKRLRGDANDLSFNPDINTMWDTPINYENRDPLESLKVYVGTIQPFEVEWLIDNNFVSDSFSPWDLIYTGRYDLLEKLVKISQMNVYDPFHIPYFINMNLPSYTFKSVIEIETEIDLYYNDRINAWKFFISLGNTPNEYTLRTIANNTIHNKFFLQLVSNDLVTINYDFIQLIKVGGNTELSDMLSEVYIKHVNTH